MTNSRRPRPTIRRAMQVCLVSGAACALGGFAHAEEPVRVIIGAGGHAQAGGGGQAPVREGRVMRMPVGGGEIMMRVDRPNAATSRADKFLRAGDNSPDAPVATGYELFNSVIFKTVDEQTAIAALREAEKRAGRPLGAQLTSVDHAGMRGLMVAQVASVADAAELASRLREVVTVRHAEIDAQAPIAALGGGTFPGDPLVGLQWHLRNDMTPGNDHRLEPVYARGYSGAGIRVGVLEPGRRSFQRTHPDYATNVNHNLSMDVDATVVNVDHGTSVTGLIAAKANNGVGMSGVAPNVQLLELRQGSEAFLIDAYQWKNGITHIKNNSWGPAANFVANPTVFFTDFATPESLAPFPVPIFSTTMDFDYSTDFSALALAQAASTGRALRGVVNVFAAGNYSMFPIATDGTSFFKYWDRFFLGNAVGFPSGTFGYWDFAGGSLVADIPAPFGWIDIGDRTEYNEQAGLIDTLAIAAVDESNTIAEYSTTGTAVLASAYSAGFNGRGIATDSQIMDFGAFDPTMLGEGFTTGFGGTSAAAPIASGIIALMLEANPRLTVRDIKHIIQRTAMPIGFDPLDFYVFAGPDSDMGAPSFWQVNGGFVKHSDEYGFGLINANGAVTMAESWAGLPPQLILERNLNEDNDAIEFDAIDVPDAEYVEIATGIFQLVPGDEVGITFCVPYNIVVEEVQVVLTASGNSPGDLLITLTSPSNSISPLSLPRVDDGSVNVGGTEYAFFDHPLVTYKHWGELSGGTWTLTFQDYRPDEELEEGDFDDMDMPVDVYTIFSGNGQIFGAPGNPMGAEKTIESVTVRIYGYDIGEDSDPACDPQSTICPWDLNVDGFVTLDDLVIFIDLWINRDPRGDWDGNGIFDIRDVLLFFQTWRPGSCFFIGDEDGDPSGGRPRPGDDGNENVIPL